MGHHLSLKGGALRQQHRAAVRLRHQQRVKHRQQPGGVTGGGEVEPGVDQLHQQTHLQGGGVKNPKLFSLVKSRGVNSYFCWYHLVICFIAMENHHV